MRDALKRSLTLDYYRQFSVSFFQRMQFPVEHRNNYSLTNVVWKKIQEWESPTVKLFHAIITKENECWTDSIPNIIGFSFKFSTYRHFENKLWDLLSQSFHFNNSEWKALNKIEKEWRRQVKKKIFWRLTRASHYLPTPITYKNSTEKFQKKPTHSQNCKDSKAFSKMSWLSIH